MPRLFQIQGQTSDNRPLGDWPNIIKEANKYLKAGIWVEDMGDDSQISLAQMAYIYSVVIPVLKKEGYSQLDAENLLKVQCGEQWLVKVIEGQRYILSKTVLTVKQGTEWIENIMSFMDSIGWPVPPPNKYWYENKQKSPTELLE